MITFVVLVVITILVILLIFSIFTKGKKAKWNLMDRAKQICTGMSKSEVINIMGKKYSLSYLQNDIEKLEWRYCEGGGGVKMSGVFAFNVGETKSIFVVFQHDIVIEVYTQ